MYLSALGIRISEDRISNRKNSQHNLPLKRVSPERERERERVREKERERVRERKKERERKLAVQVANITRPAFTKEKQTHYYYEQVVYRYTIQNDSSILIFNQCLWTCHEVLWTWRLAACFFPLRLHELTTNGCHGKSNTPHAHYKCTP